MTDNAQIITVKAADVRGAFAKLAKRCPGAVMAGLRAGAGFLARQARALMLARVKGAGGVTASGAFAGRRMADAVRVHNTPRELMVKVYLNIRDDMRAHWLNAGTAERQTGRRKSARTHARRGRVAPRRYFDDAAARGADALRIADSVAATVIEKTWKQ